MRKTTLAGLACGLCCALCVGLYVVTVRGEVDEARAEALARYGGDQIEVCVAKRDLAAGEVVDGGSVVTKMWVADLLPTGAVTDTSQIVGKRLGSSIIEGEVICAQRTEMADSTLTVPDGKAAISVPARPVQAVGGSVEPGMAVDVYATGPVSTTRLVEGALVLATSTAADGTASATGEWVTLAVEPERVQEIVAAAQNLELYFVLPAVVGETSGELPSGESPEGASAPEGAAATSGESGASPTVEDVPAPAAEPVALASADPAAPGDPTVGAEAADGAPAPAAEPAAPASAADPAAGEGVAQ